MYGDAGSGELSMMDVINILSNMSEVNATEIVQNEDLEKEFDLFNESLIREVFRILHRYLQNMVRKNENIFKDPEALKGIQALILLAEEGVAKMDRYAKLHLDKNKLVSKLKEYTDLQKYYKQHILKQAVAQPEIAERWEEQFEDAEEALEMTRRGLSNLEMVRKDEHYELFYIQSEDKKLYFNKSLLRHIRLIGNVDELIGKVEGEDPLLELRKVLDREIHEGAREMLQSLTPYVDEFYKGRKRQPDQPLFLEMNKALMALKMAAHPQNLIEQQSFKSCLEYYSDFHRFLRAAMETSAYIEQISGEIDEDQLMHAIIRVMHALCCQFFMRKEPMRLSVNLIHSMIQRGDELLRSREKKRAGRSEMQLWQDFRDRDESIRHLLKHYPNGPILRILDSLQEEEECDGFDPLMHKNFPHLQFNVENDALHLSVIRMPCPTIQQIVNRAKITEEFYGFLRFYKHDLKADKHLIVNVQNRTSWEEFARCKALEEITIQAEMHSQFFLLGLSVGTPFYSQEDEYKDLSEASEFKEQFANQIFGGNNCGYFFPIKLNTREHDDFIKDGISICHRLFFQEKAHLTQQERLNFILIFYLMYTLKIIDILEIDSISFSCKDAVDVGMGYTALFYAMIRLISDVKGWNQSDTESIEWILYSPALSIRERPIQSTILDRTLMAIEQIHQTCLEKGKGVGEALNPLYDRVKFPFLIS